MAFTSFDNNLVESEITDTFFISGEIFDGFGLVFPDFALGLFTLDGILILIF